MATILLATGDYQCSAVLSAEISAEGHEVIQAADGNEAVELALEKRPRLVILDPVLPIFSGFEVCSILRGDPGIPGSLPVLMLTDEEPDVRRLEKVGATGVLPKTHAGTEVREILAAQLGDDAGV